jgi:mannose-6-phosphate isomerase-like protein (cupin superfamily)
MEVRAMADFSVKKIDEMETTFGGGLRKARAELGVTSVGMSILTMPAGYDRYPDHDHTHDGQEEIYIVLAGSGVITIEGEEFALDGETMARVGPGTKRKLVAGPDGIRMLVLGGVPGKAYEPPEWGELGAADPMAG